MTSEDKESVGNELSKPNNLNLTIGSGDDEDFEDDRVFDMRRRMQSFAMTTDDGGMPPTVFIDDADVVPTTSTAFLGSQMPFSAIKFIDDANNMDHFVKNFFANDSCLFQNTDPGNFVEEVFTEKPPKIVGDYLFGGVIGEGSYSKVKEVMQTKTLMRRAVKIIKDKRLKKIPGGEQNVQREIQVLQRLRHINVVELFDIFRVEEKQKLYIVMEFCVCSLQLMLDHCPQKKLPEFQAQLYFSQLLDGLDYLHSQRVIHKDIKPGNLLLSLDGRLKICDFGVAEQLDGSNEDWCKTGQGTPKFQPPEVVSGAYKRFRGQLVDIWGSGVTLYNLVSGEYPFDGDVIMRLFENITTQPLEMPKNTELSASLQHLLHNTLEKNPTKRWDSQLIRDSEWFTTKLPIEIDLIVRVPSVGNSPAHRPLGVYHALEQLCEEPERSECSLGFKELPTIETSTQHKNDEIGDEQEDIRVKVIPHIHDSTRSAASEEANCVISKDSQSTEEVANGSQNSGSISKLSKIFRRKNLTNFLQRLIF